MATATRVAIKNAKALEAIAQRLEVIEQSTAAISERLDAMETAAQQKPASETKPKRTRSKAASD